MNRFQLWLIHQIVMGLVPKGVKRMVNKVREFLSGKKTYLSMAGLIIAALVQYAADGDVGKLINAVLIAIGGMGLRAGVTKVQ